MKYASWEAIRANWVNGNCADARNQLSDQSKLQMLGTIHEALACSYLAHGMGETHSGDLPDLIDIINAILRTEG